MSLPMKILEEPCQVCGHPEAGLHYNALVCDSCRIFFYRCSNFKRPFPCRRNGACMVSVSKKNRRNCASCRYQRCCDLNMDPRELRRSGHKERYLDASTVTEFMKRHHLPLIMRAPIMTPGSLEMVLMCHKMSVNESGPSPSLTSINLDIPLVEFIKNPGLCCSRDTACADFRGGLPKMKLNVLSNCGRWQVSYIDLLHSTQYFMTFRFEDMIKIVQHNLLDFRVFYLVECQLRKMLSPESWLAINENLSHVQNLSSLLSRNASIVNKLTMDIVYPIYCELKFDEIEYTALKVIALFSTPPGTSQDGMQKASLVRDVYTNKLVEHISSLHPELSRVQQMMRLSSLLGLIRQIKEVSEASAQLFREAVAKDYEGLSQRLFYDLLIRRY